MKRLQGIIITFAFKNSFFFLANISLNVKVKILKIGQIRQSTSSLNFQGQLVIRMHCLVCEQTYETKV